jgi:hypothetical protein
MGPTVYFPAEGRSARDNFALKNPTASGGFEPANLGNKGPRPPKPLKLWVTTRPHLREKLREKPLQLSYNIDPFYEGNQDEFKTNCVKMTGLLRWGGEEEFKTKQEICVKHLIRNLSQSISDRDKVFTGITLQCRMLEEAFDKELLFIFLNYVLQRIFQSILK